MTPNPVNTLSAVVEVATPVPTSAGLTATAGDHEVTIPPGDATATEHELALVGLRPETTYQVMVEATDDAGQPVEVEGPLSFTSGPLPDDFPPVSLQADQQKTAEGLTLVSLKPWAAPQNGQAAPADVAAGADPARPAGYLAAVDQDGFVVWYHATELGVLDARQLDNGNFLFTYDETVVREIDVLGRDVRELAGRVARETAPADFHGTRRATDEATAMNTDSAHHDVGPLPNGNLLLLSSELQEVTGPPQCGEDADQVTYPVISDVVVEVDPDSGDIVGEWPLSEIYNPFERPGEELCKQGTPFAPPNFFYSAEGRRDWTHGNSVVLDEERNALIVSLRHLNAVLAIRYQDDENGPAGELLWELGPDGTLPLEGEPAYYQHAAEVLEGDGILVYDNGNSRPGASVGGSGAPPYSRAVIYDVDRSSPDPADWSARQVWEHVLQGDDGTPVFTAFLGDVDMLENGNVLVTHGAIADEAGNLTARVVEVVPEGESGGEVVFDLRVGNETSGWTVYRSQRFTSLTPGRE